uniref:Ubiquitin-like domain-containing protein n=1 Tax=Leptocylindrus danicus TaxID=163516 RepID=A0A7S2JSB3_9STRA|mmetsp:Transcript_10986/g.16586  ORF Transcript_10986/g.16586 Transcript_10986/m.16586 type:complete len:445 (+) Transcript_10986:43-1377(+)
MKLFLSLTSSPSTPRTPIELPEDASADKLRELVAEETKIPLDKLKIIYRGRMIQKSENVVSDFKLEEDSVLHCMGKPLSSTSTASAADDATDAATNPTPSSSSTTKSTPSDCTNESSTSTNFSTVIQSGEMKRSVDATTFQTALSTLLKLVNNVISHPNEEKYRKVKQSNGAFQRRLGGLTGAKELMFSAGFVEETVEGDGLVYLMKPSAEAWPKLLQTQSALQAATTTASSTSTSTATSTSLPFMPPPQPSAFPNNPNPAAMQNAMNMLQDPNALQSMLSNPMMQQALLNDPRIANDPMMRQSMETFMRDPAMLSRMLSDPMMRSRLEQAMSMASASGSMNMLPAATGPSPAVGMGNAGADANLTDDMMQRMQQMQQLQQFMSAMNAQGTANGSGASNTNIPPPGNSNAGNASGSGSGNSGGDSQMTEEEMIAEAIARSLREN